MIQYALIKRSKDSLDETRSYDTKWNSSV